MSGRLPKPVQKIYGVEGMGVSALTIEGSTSSSEELVRRLSSALGRLGSPSAALVFVTGNLVAQLDAIAAGIKAHHPGLCAVVAGTEGVFTERGEVEAKDGYGCLIHSGRPANLTTFESPIEPLVTVAQGAPIFDDIARGPSIHLFSNFPAGAGHQGRIPCGSSDWGWFGAVTTTDALVWGVDGDGDMGPAEVARLEFPGLEPPILLSGACCRIVGEPMVVTAASGSTLFELDNMPALVALGKLTSRLAERSWIVLALLSDKPARTTSRSEEVLAHFAAMSHERMDEPVFRPLRGIDPSQGALVLKEPLTRGARIAFAVRDERAAKRNFEEALRRGKQRMSGTAPRFGVYFEGLGRGRQLYGLSNVEVSQIRQILGEFPLLGSRSTLELREHGGSVVVQTMSGQLALFTNPS